MPSVVYFIQAVIGGPIKIGSTVNIQARLVSMQTGCPFELRVRGEWFRPEGALAQFVESLGGDILPARAWGADHSDTHRRNRRFTRTVVGYRFSEAARLLWDVAGDMRCRRSVAKAIGITLGHLTFVLWGGATPRLDLAIRIRDRFGIAVELWGVAPREPFILPAARPAVAA